MQVKTYADLHQLALLFGHDFTSNRLLTHKKTQKQATCLEIKRGSGGVRKRLPASAMTAHVS